MIKPPSSGFSLPLLLTLPWLLGACGQEAPPPLPPRPVLVQGVADDGGQGQQRYSATIRSRTEAPLAFQVGGKLQKRLVDVGSPVRAGQVLARLDPADQALNLAAVEAELSLAQAEAERYRTLKARNFVSQTALDGKETALKAARAQAELARNQRGYTDLLADQAGVIARVEAEVGQVVAPGQTVLRLARPDQPEAAFDLPESRMGKLRVGDRVQVRLWADGERDYPGQIREIGAVADAATRTYPVRVRIESADPALKLGMSATVSVDMPGAGLRLPGGAIFQQGDQPAVWVVGQDDKVSLRPVQVLAWEEGYARIGGGLQGGERVVVAGAHKLAPGEQIQPQERRP